MRQRRRPERERPRGRALGGGTLAYALAGPVGELDPLLAQSRSDQIVTRQVHEPLVASLDGAVRKRATVARARDRMALDAGPRDLELSAALRHPLRGRDPVQRRRGARQRRSAGARSSPAARFCPSSSPSTLRVPTSSASSSRAPCATCPPGSRSPRLGIVSPRALRPHDGTAARLAQPDRSGTGPFELREAQAGGQLLLAANTDWWGTRLDLGPALDQIRFEIAPRAGDRLALLESGEVQVADELDPGAIRRLRADPLLTYVAGADRAVLGLQRSVRGIDSATAIEPLSNVWLTVVGVG